MWTEIAIAGGFIGTQGVILGWLNSRINKMEVDRKKELYKPDGQTNYIPRNECKEAKKEIKHTFCDKIDEVKTLILSMDTKRAEAKDEYYKGLVAIESRLTRIEGKLP